MITTLFVNYYVIPSTSFKHEMCIQTDTDRQADRQTKDIVKSSYPKMEEFRKNEGAQKCLSSARICNQMF